MTALAWYFGAQAIAVCAIAVAWLNRSRRGCVVVLLATLAALPLLYAGGVSLLGRPRPAVLMPWRIRGARIVSFLPDPGVAIYVWVVTPDADEPLALTLPWDEKEAEDLVQAAAAAQQNGTDVRAGPMGGFQAMANGAEGGKRRFWPTPQPPTPDKPSQP